eukprot:1773584-Pyramimonas_sp.AAC.1
MHCSEEGKRHKHKLSTHRADLLGPRGPPLAAPPTPPMARAARQGGAPSADLGNPRRSPEVSAYAVLCSSINLAGRCTKSSQALPP